MEIEAKFAIPTATLFQKLQTYTRLGVFSLTNAKVKRVHDTYMDTKQRHLCKAGYAFRERKQSDGWLLTLKSLGGIDGAIRRREELEILLKTPMLPAAWSPCPMRDRVLEIIQDNTLMPLLALEQTRVTRIITLQNREVAELSLDQVHMRRKENKETFFTLEAELLSSGSEEDLAKIVELLQGEWGLAPEQHSKLEHAQIFFGVQMEPISPPPLQECA